MSFADERMTKSEIAAWENDVAHLLFEMLTKLSHDAAFVKAYENAVAATALHDAMNLKTVDDVVLPALREAARIAAASERCGQLPAELIRLCDRLELASTVYELEVEAQRLAEHVDAFEDDPDNCYIESDDDDGAKHNGLWPPFSASSFIAPALWHARQIHKFLKKKRGLDELRVEHFTTMRLKTLDTYIKPTLATVSEMADKQKWLDHLKAKLVAMRVMCYNCERCVAEIETLLGGNPPAVAVLAVVGGGAGAGPAAGEGPAAGDGGGAGAGPAAGAGAGAGDGAAAGDGGATDAAGVK
jgi:hypothetical protein